MTTASRCPVCSRPIEAAFRPFCSRACADVDLLRWLRGGYAIPGGLTDEDGKTERLSEGPPTGEAGAPSAKLQRRRRDA